LKVQNHYKSLDIPGFFTHTTLVAIVYMVLAVQERERKDDCTLGELFYLLIDGLSEQSVSEAIFQLFELFQEAFHNECILKEETLNNILEHFVQKLLVTSS